MSKLTKQHFEHAAEEVASNHRFRQPRDRRIITEFLVAFFKHWNPEFSESRFREACSPHPAAKKSGQLKRTVQKYKTDLPHYAHPGTCKHGMAYEGKYCGECNS